MLTIHNIGKIYNKNWVVDIDRLNISAGEIVGLVGNNGAGKTTLFRLILDLVKADKGGIISKDKSIALSDHWKMYTAAYLDENFLIGYLTPKEYFYFCGRLQGFTKSRIDESIQKFEPFFDGVISNSKKYIRELSKGNQCKIGIAACLLKDPDILILDEPFANLDPSSQIRLIKMLRHLQQQKPRIILVSSHDLNHITETCTRILLLENGKIIRDVQTSKNTLSELGEYFKVDTDISQQVQPM